MAYVGHVEVDKSFNLDEKRNRFYTVEFLVEVDDPREDPYDVATYVGIGYEDVWESYPDAKFKTCSAKALDGENAYWWRVVANFDTVPFESSQIATPTSGGTPGEASPPGSQNQDVEPDERGVTFTMDSVTVEEPWQFDALVGDGQTDPIVNVLGEPFQEPQTILRTRKLLTFTKTVDYDSTTIAESVNFEESINANMWAGFEARHCRCVKHNLTPVKEKDKSWWVKTVQIEIDILRPYNPVKLLNTGTYSLEDGERGTCVDRYGNNITAPLNEFGEMLSEDDILARNFYFVTYSKYREVNWDNII